MSADRNELPEIQAELQAVKKALREAYEYLGMKGETLQRYFLQLNEKENLLLSRQLRNLSEAPEPLLPSVGSVTGNGTLASRAVSTAASSVRLEPRSPPSGPTQTFNKDTLDGVITHLVTYEASVTEAAKALRALSSLAYADAHGISEDDRVLPQVLRVLSIHPDEDGLHLAAMRAFCNMAYAPTTALGRLAADSGVLSALVSAMARNGGPKEICAKANEALARIVAAEVNPEGGEAGNANVTKAFLEELEYGSGALAGIITVTSAGDPSWFDVTLKLVLQLIANEVVEPKFVAQRFCVAAADARKVAATSAGWLGFAKQLASCDCPELSQALVDAGVIRSAASLMDAHVGDGAVQLAGIEGMSGLVGNRWSGLLSFADVKGMGLIEAAMRGHIDDPVLQTKGVRALASGIQWPEDVQHKSSYSSQRSVSLTKAAMAQHGSDVELQIAALEALAKYLDRLHCVDDVKADGGEGLVKAMMTRHIATQKVQAWGKAVLDGIGAGRNWAPKNA